MLHDQVERQVEIADQADMHTEIVHLDKREQSLTSAFQLWSDGVRLRPDKRHPFLIGRTIGQQNDAAKVENGQRGERQMDATKGIKIARSCRDDTVGRAKQFEEASLARGHERQRRAIAADSGRGKVHSRRTLGPSLKEGTIEIEKNVNAHADSAGSGLAILTQEQ